MAWWREALEEIAAGKAPRAHPVLDYYASAWRGVSAPPGEWDRLIEARGKDLDPAPFATSADLEHYVDATAGGVMRIAMAACGVNGAAHEPAVGAAAQAWGCVGLLRAEPHWRARGRVLTPREDGSLSGLGARARSAIVNLRALSKSLPAPAFPALGYATLASAYLRAREHGAGDAPLIIRQLRLVAAAATGRL